MSIYIINQLANKLTFPPASVEILNIQETKEMLLMRTTLHWLGPKRIHQKLENLLIN